MTSRPYSFHSNSILRSGEEPSIQLLSDHKISQVRVAPVQAPGQSRQYVSHVGMNRWLYVHSCTTLVQL